MSGTKHEWRKSEKEIYLPKTKPVIIDIPEFKYFSVRGEGDPNKEVFGEYIGALYSLSYGVSMSYKKGIEPKGFYNYTVYPLEGVWDLKEEAKKVFDEGWSKDDLIFDAMIRQPDFVTQEFFESIREQTKVKKPNKHLDEVELLSIKEGKCCQMMHIGSYDDEAQSFEKMEIFCKEQGLERAAKTHREIYLSDPRKTEPDKLKTVLRFKVINPKT
jgi:hypothetical protein